MKKTALIFLSILVLLGCWDFFNRYNLGVTLRRGCYARIPVQFAGNSALIEVEIEGNKYPLKLDLGAACQFALFGNALKIIHKKKFAGIVLITDIKGNQYEENSYLIPCIQKKNIKCTNAIVLEEHENFIEKGALLWRSDQKRRIQAPFMGRIGRDFFISNNLFIDFPNSMIFVTNSLDQLKKDHWHIRNLFETEFEINRWGIIVSIETDIGIKKFILDTGASASILRESQVDSSLKKEAALGLPTFTSMKFSIGGHDFGPLNILLFEMDHSVDADGYLGLDFFKKHAIYLDFKNNRAFIGESSKVCGAIVF
ncbi:MAG: hypothetical protein WCF19_04280 [Chlamydiales bacterium]